MRVFVAVASSDTQYVKSHRSCHELNRRDGDDMFLPNEFGIGLTSRIQMEQGFWDHPEYDALLCLDADQAHPVDMLEKLRTSMEEGDLDMVCAHCYRRTFAPVQSLCFELGDGTWPSLPILDPPTEGLHEISSTGFGCVLIHRRVLAGLREYLPKGVSPFAAGPISGMSKDRDLFGQDFRFFLLARRLGYRLWLRADCESLHGVTMWLGHYAADRLMDYTRWANAAHQTFIEDRLRIHGMNLEAFKQRRRILEARKKGLLDQLAKMTADGKEGAELHALTVALHQMDGKLGENAACTEWMEKYPPVTRPDQLPTTADTPQQETIFTDAPEASLEEVMGMRMEALRANALDYIGDVPNVRDNGSG